MLSELSAIIIDLLRRATLTIIRFIFGVIYEDLLSSTSSRKNDGSSPARSFARLLTHEWSEVRPWKRGRLIFSSPKTIGPSPYSVIHKRIAERNRRLFFDKLVLAPTAFVKELARVSHCDCNQRDAPDQPRPDQTRPLQSSRNR